MFCQRLLLSLINDAWCETQHHELRTKINNNTIGECVFLIQRIQLFRWFSFLTFFSPYHPMSRNLQRPELKKRQLKTRQLKKLENKNDYQEEQGTKRKTIKSHQICLYMYYYSKNTKHIHLIYYVIKSMFNTFQHRFVVFFVSTDASSFLLNITINITIIIIVIVFCYCFGCIS